MAAQAFLWLRRAGAALAAEHGGFLTAVASLLVHSAGPRARGPQHGDAGLGGCGARAWLLCGVWGLPRSGIEPEPPTSAGGFSTTEPPGKLLLICLPIHQSINPSFYL